MTFRRALLIGARLGTVIGLLLIAAGLLDDWRRERPVAATFPAWCQHGRGAGDACPWCEPGGGW